MNTPLTSVITRTIPGRELFLERCISSVLSQKNKEYEHLIVVDGSNVEGTKKVVDPFLKKYRGRVAIYNTQEPYGRMEAASNVGLINSTGKYVVIHDDDDSWDPMFLDLTVGFLEQNTDPSVRGVVTQAVKVTESFHDSIIVEDQRDLFLPSLKGISLFRVLGENVFPPISFVYERSIIDEIGMYREDLPVLGDWEFNVRFLQKYDIAFIPVPAANYHFRYTSDQVIGNTVTTGIGKHFVQETKLRNELLREDLKEKRVGQGVIMAMSYENVKMSQELEELRSMITDVRESSHSTNLLVEGLRRSLPYRLARKIKRLIKRT